MPNRNLNQLLREIEESVDDELTYLSETGPAFFSTPQLIRLKGQWESRNQLFHKIQKLLIRVAAFSPTWLLMWLACYLIDLPTLATVALALFPFNLFLFAAGLLLIRYLFPGTGHSDMMGELIRSELQSRKTEQKLSE